MKSEPIFVTKPSLPSLDELYPLLEEIWSSGILTNCGPVHQRFEQALAEHLGVEYLCLFNNGTIALMAALAALDLQGEVITTPYSFVATANAIVWNGLTPVFVDVAPQSLNLDPQAIEAAITDKTTAILPVHCYGHPCEVAAIDAIAKRHNLRVLYDAAHAFGVEMDGVSVLQHGDLSVLSLHATKVFNTFEGGAVISRTKSMHRRVQQLRNFGYESEDRIVSMGLNGKMSELHAAVGLLQLKTVEENIRKRRHLTERYEQRLGEHAGIRVLSTANESKANYAYLPVLVDADVASLSRDEMRHRLIANGIFPRRYFYPLIPELDSYVGVGRSGVLDHAKRAADQVLCMPLSAEFTLTQIDRICDLFAEALVASP